MQRIFVLLWVVFGLVFSLANVSCAERNRYDQYSVVPLVELQPGFTTDPRQTFTLDLAGIGREPIELQAVEINGRTLPRRAWTERLNNLTIVPQWDLQPGLNRVTVKYDHPPDSIHERRMNPIVHTFFVNYQRARRRIEIEADGIAVIDGQRRLIRAGYRSGNTDEFSASLPSATVAGFNMVHDYRLENYRIEHRGLTRYIQEARSYLEAAHELDLGVFLGLPRALVRDYDEEKLAAIVSELSNEPALWMWYIYDEPSEKTLSVETASRVYNLLRRLDPGRPSIITTNRMGAMLQYYPFCDVLWYDRYPIVATADDLSSLAPIAGALQTSLQSVAADKPVWPVLQLHDNKGDPKLRKRVPGLSTVSDATHRPNEAELRAQAHVAFALGLMSVVYYWPPESWYSMKTDTPGVWQSLSRVLHELRSLEPILLSREEGAAANVSGGHDKVMMWSRRYQGNLYVGLVNASVHTPAKLTVKAPADSVRVNKVVGDGQFSNQEPEIQVRLGAAGVIVLCFESK